jgi:hypothetical protein
MLGGGEAVELVEEEHRRGLRTRVREDRRQLLLALTEPLVQHVADRDVDEARVALPGGRACDERLAAAGRAVHQDAAASALFITLEQKRLTERGDDPLLDLPLQFVVAADLGERDPGRVALLRTWRGRHGEPSASAA